MPIEIRILIDILLVLLIASIVAYWTWGPSRINRPWLIER